MSSMNGVPAYLETIGSGPTGVRVDHRIRAAQALAAEGPDLASLVDLSVCFAIPTPAAEAFATGREIPETTEGLARLARLLSGRVVCVRPSPFVESGLTPGQAWFATAINLDSIKPAVQAAASVVPEPAAVLVTPAAGSCLGSRFLPTFSVLGSSLNPYAWNEYIDPAAGAVRIAAGLGTRFGDRSAEDFTRFAPIGAPKRRPESSFEEIQQYSQRRADFFDFGTQQVDSDYLQDLFADTPEFPADLLLSRDGEASAVTFAPLLARAGFLETVTRILQTLERAFEAPVEIELAGSLDAGGSLELSLTDCAPAPAVPRDRLQAGRAVFRSRGPVLGRSREVNPEWIVYVPTDAYARLAPQDRYEVARAIGRINAEMADGDMVLIGPGRWATSSPSLGVPVRFAEISQAAAVVEVAEMHDGLVPELSGGSHILNELIARDLLYVGVSPATEGHELDADGLAAAPDHAEEFEAAAGNARAALRVIRASELGRPVLAADAALQAAALYVES